MAELSEEPASLWRRWHPGVLAAKVSDFGSNLLKCPRVQIWAPNLLKSATWPLAPSNVLSAKVCARWRRSTKRSSLYKKVFAPRADQIC